MAQQVTLDEVLGLVRQLSAADRARLVREMTRDQHTGPRRSLLGAYAGLGPTPSEEDIKEVRREMWADFGKDDRK